MVFSATFNNVSARSWRSVISVEETGEDYRPAASQIDHIMFYRVHLALSGIRTHNHSVKRIGLGCIYFIMNYLIVMNQLNDTIF